MRRRARDPRGMPECLTRFDWREWRPPAPADHPFPYYVEWYLALHDFDEARDAWLAGRPALLPPERPLPDPIPYTGLLPPVGGQQKPGRDAVVEHRSHPIRNH